MGSSRAFGIAAPWGAAHAGCTASPAVDNCLVGTWQQSGGCPAEWMRQHMKAAQVTVTATKALFTFKADGTFLTSKVDATAQVTAKDGQMQATSQMSAQASGQWSAAGGKLTFCNTALNSQGTMELKLPGGKTTTVPFRGRRPRARRWTTAAAATRSRRCSRCR